MADALEALAKLALAILKVEHRYSATPISRGGKRPEWPRSPDESEDLRVQRAAFASALPNYREAALQAVTRQGVALETAERRIGCVVECCHGILTWESAVEPMVMLGEDPEIASQVLGEWSERTLEALDGLHGLIVASRAANEPVAVESDGSSDGSPPAADTLSKEALAVATLMENPDWPKERIAEHVGVTRSQLYKMPRFKAALKALKGDVPRGGREGGRIEAVGDDGRDMEIDD